MIRIQCTIKLMKKNDVWDTKINPDGISEEVLTLNDLVWNRGYCCETDDGTWWKVFVTDKIKKGYPIDLSNEEEKETFKGFHDLNLDHYESDGQITFFEPYEEDVYTINELTDILI